MALNPLTAVIEGLRAGLLQTGCFDLNLWIPSLLFTGVLVFSGVVVFQRVERNCVDAL
jgi:lipopolysaccharide transport system permease protein